ncbi:MAG: hypothetical protein FD189_2136 [Elusimicrobia bacterium]|nr:MAG: hypothetical protein FD154_2193 [Elusimicrobiota bacterium]KAF0154020.1 MAG: hypothetical protein FD189_2136 [Elusimicrobiota bacterium]
MGHLLNKLLTKKEARRLAAETYFQRGLEYYKNGCVQEVLRSGDSLRAVVRGSSLYGVRLWVMRGRLRYSCDCPLGEEGEFCKHLAAASLAWLADPTGGETAGGGVTEEEIRRYLSSMEKEALMDFILEQAACDGDLYDQLKLAAARGGRRGAGKNAVFAAPLNGRATRRKM